MPRSNLINRGRPRKSNSWWLARACGERSRIHASDEHTLHGSVSSEQRRPDAAKCFCPTGGAAFCLWLRCSSVVRQLPDGYASSSTPYQSQKSTATRPLTFMRWLLGVRQLKRTESAITQHDIENQIWDRRKKIEYQNAAHAREICVRNERDLRRNREGNVKPCPSHPSL